MHNLNFRLTSADNLVVRPESTPRDALQSGAIPWALQMRAISTEQPSRLVKTVTGAILGCGGWMLSRSATDSGLIDMLFEFERPSCLEIYTALVASGLELGRAAHLQFTELCLCTRLASRDCSQEIVSVDLEIQTFAMEEQANPPPNLQ